MKKNRDFFYLQYNQINWKNQEKTGINSSINNHIIQNIILKHPGTSISVFDIGFGIGYFIRMLCLALTKRYKKIIIEGTEPSKTNYDYYLTKVSKEIKIASSIKTFDNRFLDVKTSTTFDIITAIYVFPHFLFNELQAVVDKIYSMLNEKGKFVLVLANEKYLKEKLDSEKDLFIESGEIEFNGKNYKEILHYSDIPEIGKLIDYNREEVFYEDLFVSKKFLLKSKEILDDNGFICTLFVFQKE